MYKKRKKKNFALKGFIVVLSAIILSTLGIKAADKFNKNLEDNKSLCPRDMVYIMSSEGDFCIDKYEVSPSKDCPFINPKNQGETRSNLDLKDCRPVSLKDKTPWSFISQNQAMMACARAGKRQMKIGKKMIVRLIIIGRTNPEKLEVLKIVFLLLGLMIW